MAYGSRHAVGHRTSDVITPKKRPLPLMWATAVSSCSWRTCPLTATFTCSDRLSAPCATFASATSLPGSRRGPRDDRPLGNGPSSLAFRPTYDDRSLLQRFPLNAFERAGYLTMGS